MTLTYEPYKSDKIAVRGDLKYDDDIRNLGGRWNSRMKGGAGWTVPIESKDDLLELIKKISPPEDDDEMNII